MRLPRHESVITRSAPADLLPDRRSVATRGLFWTTVWLAFALVAVKASYLGVPGTFTLGDGREYLRSLAAISYLDVVFAGLIWAAGRAALMLAGDRRLATRVVLFVFVSFSAFSCLYAAANVLVFGVFGGFLTYPLLSLVGDVRMLRSSVAALLTPRVVAGLVCLPVIYVGLVRTMVRRMPRGNVRHEVALALLGVWVILGQQTFTTEWASRQDRQIADNPHWVFIASWWQTVNGEGSVRMTDSFAAADLTDFEPVGLRPPPSPSLVFRNTSTGAHSVRAKAARRPPNVILVVLESVAARWVSLNGGLYDTTPTLAAESKRSLMFDSFYAHIGRSSNSLAAMLLSIYPKLDFGDLTQEYPHLAGTSLAAVFHDRGYRTAFVTPSDLRWAGWNTFLAGRGFGDVRDYHDLSCSDLLSSWGVEDRCMVDGMIQFIDQEPTRPFFLMAWSQQTHHPYEPTPGVPLLDLQRERIPDDYDLGRYLNVLHETDRHLGRLFAAIRRAGLDQDTLIVITGDHGQAFGYPHDSYMQGRTVYEEDVHVPLMYWFPRVYQSATRAKTVGSQVDLAPTIAELAGVPVAPDWQGRSLFDTGHAARAYFYVAEDHFALGVREGNWKYIFDLREGVEELYDLDHDPTEQQNLAAAQPERCARLRQRLAAWTEANRRQYQRASGT
jgi:phosphoglycerol transferase MdoB-like AlkP superfamily enzyme